MLPRVFPYLWLSLPTHSQKRPFSWFSRLVRRPLLPSVHNLFISALSELAGTGSVSPCNQDNLHKTEYIRLFSLSTCLSSSPDVNVISRLRIFLQDNWFHDLMCDIHSFFVSSVRSSNSHPDLLVITTTPLFQITPVLNTGLSLSEPLQLYKGYNAI